MIPKFRAWSTDKKIMAEVRTLRFTDELVETDKFVERSIEGVKLMQSTGLKDENGKEIFEGDILKFNDEWADYGYEGYIEGSIEGINYVEIKREKTCFTFGKTKLPESSLIDLVENEHYPFEGLLIEASYEFEIIGNVYENPELLEVTK